MNDCRHSTRRAAALLIVLATLILTTTAAAIVVRAAVSHQIDVRINHCSAIADDLLAAAEAPIQDWLASKSSKVVLPPDASMPDVAVLHDLWLSNGECIELTITAWDQCGMVSLQAIENGSPLRRMLSEGILRQVPTRSLEARPSKAPAGLDQLVALDDAAQSIRESPFPVAARSDRSLSIGDVSVQSVASDSSPMTMDGELPIGAVVATHANGIINVNTAPVPLVEAALRLAGRGGLEQIIAARQAGKPASIGGQASSLSEPNPFAPQLVTSSGSWAFRIDINIGPRKCSWWAIYANNSGNRGWECAQRLVITH
jgi:hypothetical protein